MAFEDDVAVVVTPRELQIFSVQIQQDGCLVSDHLRSIDLSPSIGFAQSFFTRPTGLENSSTFYLALSGVDGLFVYRIATYGLRYGDHLPEIMSLKTDAAECLASHGPADYTYQPSFSASGETLSWLVGNFEDFGRPGRFATLSCGLAYPSNSDDISETPAHYELSHSDLPSLYAASVYDFDYGLGVAVFGNAYGELAMVCIDDRDIKDLMDCFDPLNLSPLSGEDEIASKVTYSR
jgi:hypothetical protein